MTLLKCNAVLVDVDALHAAQEGIADVDLVLVDHGCDADGGGKEAAAVWMVVARRQQAPRPLGKYSILTLVRNSQRQRVGALRRMGSRLPLEAPGSDVAHFRDATTRRAKVLR